MLAHDPPNLGVSLRGALGGTAETTPNRPQGTPGVPAETLSGESPRSGGGFVPELLRSLHSYFAGEPVSFADVPLEEAGERRSRTRSQPLSAPSRGARWSRTASSRRSRAEPRRTRCGDVLCREPVLALRPLPPGRLVRRYRRLRRARRRVQASPPGPGRLARWGSLTIYARSSRRSRPGAAAVGWRSSLLFHSARSIHLRGRGSVALHLDLASSAIARRSFSLLRRLSIDSEIRTYNRRAFDRATRYQLHVEGDPHALATLGSRRS